MRERFAALPEIVALLDPDTGVTADGIPVELVVAPERTLGTALVRATGPAEHVAALGSLPAARDEKRSTGDSVWAGRRPRFAISGSIRSPRCS